jgi:8-oxo-dGTP pyrophosphatase MutT (NUDIX family)
MKSEIKYQDAHGVLLVRNNPNKNKRLEILMIKRRITYHFKSFVMGHYHIRGKAAFLKYLFDNMTSSEKLDILCRNFAQMWYRAMLVNPEAHRTAATTFNQEFSYKSYNKKLAKFERVFGSDPNLLKSLIHQSRTLESLWDFPKGRREQLETSIEAAMRELKEEVGIDPSQYTLLPEPLEFRYKDQDVVYVNHFYIAKLKDNAWSPHMDFSCLTQIFETEYIDWIGKQDVPELRMNRKLERQCIKVFDAVKKQLKKK